MTKVNHFNVERNFRYYNTPKISQLALGTESVICVSIDANKPGGMKGSEDNLFDLEPED